MSHERFGFLGKFAQPQNVGRWSRALKSPSTLTTRDLSSMHAEMLTLRDSLERMAGTARTELLARVGAADGILRPDQCDWAERSAPWRQRIHPRGHVDFGSPLPIGGGVTLFHDATQADVSLRQDPSPAGIVGPVFGLVLEVYRFDGSFLSIVQDLPEAAIRDLTLNHFFGVQLRISREQPLEIYARLNVQHGPNLEQIVRQFRIENDRGVAEFDLAYSAINEKRVEKAWLDLILEGPEMNRVALWDMVMIRAPRADI
ncbi:hypothetical protein HKCCSP123_09860 [Rhodobacterales bacterium HKCCSP123]|nr:hypothetical protein [Rhodobacterales bacterium HKCCSP123]